MDYSLYHYSDLQFREVGSQNVNGADKLSSDGSDEKDSQVTQILRDMSQGTVSVDVAVTQLKNLGIDVQEIANGDVLTFSFTYNNKNYMFTTTKNGDAAGEGNNNSGLSDYLDNYENITPNLQSTATADDASPVDYNQDWAIVKVKASELHALIEQGVIAYPIEGPDGKTYYVSFYNEEGTRIDDVTEGGRSEYENNYNHDVGVIAGQGDNYIYINLPYSLIHGELHDVIKNDSNSGVYRDDLIDYKNNSLGRHNGINIPDDSLNDKEFIKTGYTGPIRTNRTVTTPTISNSSNSYDGKWGYVRVKASDILKYGLLPEDLRLSFFDGETGVRIDGDGGYTEDYNQLKALGDQYIYINLPYSAITGEFGEIVKNDPNSFVIEDPDNSGFDKHEIFEYLYDNNGKCIGKKLAHFDKHIDNDIKQNGYSGKTTSSPKSGNVTTPTSNNTSNSYAGKWCYVRVKASDILKYGLLPEDLRLSFFDGETGVRIDGDGGYLDDYNQLKALGDQYIYINLPFSALTGEFGDIVRNNPDSVVIQDPDNFGFDKHEIFEYLYDSNGKCIGKKLAHFENHIEYNY